jgi:hypothetical protein|tara:strand:+ start:208 stop:438 length:231 start_codon:yes stop_codon:yes gene_type:complete
MNTNRVKITKTPTENYPQMVTVSTKNNKYKTLNSKRFINSIEAKKQVELIRCNQIVSRICNKVLLMNSEFMITDLG